jgi:hypothetical protein
VPIKLYLQNATKQAIRTVAEIQFSQHGNGEVV